MTRKRRSFKVGSGIFLAPEDEVGSSIRYVAEIEHPSPEHEPLFRSHVWITDCDNKICWSGYGTYGFQHQRKKVRRAIRVMEQFLEQLDKAEPIYLAVKAEWKAKHRGEGQQTRAARRSARTITVDPSQIVEVR